MHIPENNKGGYVQYKGKSQKILLKYKRDHYYFEKGSAHGTLYYYFNEIINSQVTGQYIIALSANIGEVKYKRLGSKKIILFEGYNGNTECN